MTARGLLEKARPYAPALFLIIAVAAGGLRAPAPWLAFGLVLAAWIALRPGWTAAAGREAALLFFFWLAAAAVFSPEPSVSLGALGRYAVFALFFFSASSGGEGERDWLRAVYALGAAAAAVMLFQWVLGVLSVGGFIGKNPNYSAAFCAAAFAPAALALAAAGARREKLLYGCLAALLAAGLAASGSRGGMLAAFAAAACGYGFTRRWRWLAGLLVLAAAAAALLPAETWRAALKFDDPRAFARPQLWGAALKAAAASPLLGWGPGRFNAVFELFKFPADWLARYGHTTLHAHGEFFNLAAEAGFPAALLLLLAAAQGLSSGDPGRAPYRLAALAVLLQASVDIVFYSGAVSLLFWGSLGFAAAGAPAADRPRLRYALAAAAALCLLAPAAAGLLRPRGAEAQALDEARHSPVAALALVRSRAAAEPYNALHAADEGRLLAAVGDLAGAGAAFGRALELEPDFADARLGLAGVLAAGGRRAEACAALAGLPRRAPGIIRNDYERAVLLHDQERAAALKKDLCGKKKAGAATATSPKRRSTATK